MARYRTCSSFFVCVCVGEGGGLFLFMRAHAPAMNEYREGSTEVVVRRRKSLDGHLWTEIVDRRWK